MRRAVSEFFPGSSVHGPTRTLLYGHRQYQVSHEKRGATLFKIQRAATSQTHTSDEAVLTGPSHVIEFHESSRPLVWAK
jgi:hypothetical protein